MQHKPFCNTIEQYNQLDNYISWRPDPGAMLTDAFQTNWKELKGYAFLPFFLINRCLQKVRKEESTYSIGGTSVVESDMVPNVVRTSSGTSPAHITLQ